MQNTSVEMHQNKIQILCVMFYYYYYLCLFYYYLSSNTVFCILKNCKIGQVVSYCIDISLLGWNLYDLVLFWMYRPFWCVQLHVLVLVYWSHGS